MYFIWCPTYLDAVHVSDCSLVCADVQVRGQGWMQVLYRIPGVLYLVYYTWMLYISVTVFLYVRVRAGCRYSTWYLVYCTCCSVPSVLYLDTVYVSDCSLVCADVQVRCQGRMQILYMIPGVLYLVYYTWMLYNVHVSDCSLVCADVQVRGEGWM